MRDKYDLIVVGAGPAGSMTARSAAREGAEVLLLDKRRELGVPVQCGEALAEDVLRELGIKPDPRWTPGRTNAVKLIAPSGSAVRIAEKKVVGKVGYILDRKVFDKHLAVLAAKEGADVRVGTIVDGLLTDGGKIRGVKGRGIEGRFEALADIVVAADGVGSRVARWAGVNTTLKLDDIETCAQFQMVGVDFESSSMMEFYFGNEISAGGYCWVFPKGEDMANVGLGVLGSRAKKTPMEYLKSFVERTPALSKGKVVEINCGGVPVCGPMKTLVKGNLMIVGDAARQVNPLTGGGIDSAMRAGDLAGRVAADAVKKNKVTEKELKRYEKEWLKRNEKRMKRYLAGKEILLGMKDEELDKLADALNKVEFDKISLTEILKVLAKAYPKFFLKIRKLF